jgi:hypothetical protein|tara:strand:- start:776 stop:991 length:216 start_codon:yes stop_codon:yes gene_type:complete
MSIEPVSAESFEEWKYHPVTKRFMKMLQTDRETMKEGLINNAFEEEAEVKGRCRVIATILNLEYEDLFETK